MDEIIPEIRDMVILWMIKTLTYEEFLASYILRMELKINFGEAAKGYIRRGEKICEKADTIKKMSKTKQGRLESYVLYLANLDWNHRGEKATLHEWDLVKFKRKYQLSKAIIEEVDNVNMGG